MKDILTNRFILRKVRENDVKDMFNILSNEKVVETLNMVLHTKLNDTEELIKDYLTEYLNGNKYPFAIVDKNTNEFLGVFLIKLDLYCENSFEFTIYIKPTYWGKGIYKEILPYMVQFAFENIKTGNFRGYIMEGNIASEKVLLNCNFKLEKIFNLENLGTIKSYIITEEMYKNK